MKLGKALRVKNSLVAKIAKSQTLIKKYNSFVLGTKPDFNAEELYQQYIKSVAKLIELKTKISVANRPIIHILHEIDELKAEISFLSELSCKSGTYADRYDGKETTYDCSISEVEKIARIDKSQVRIFELQDQLAEHNATTEIDFSQQY